jgi:hypothetical protein
MHERAFVLMPLAEIGGDEMNIPGRGTVASLLAQVADQRIKNSMPNRKHRYIVVEGPIGGGRPAWHELSEYTEAELLLESPRRTVPRRLLSGPPTLAWPRSCFSCSNASTSCPA